MQTETQAPPRNRPAEPCKFLTGRQVQNRYQRSHVTLWRWIRDEEIGFPAPVKIRRHNYWKLEDLEAWEAEQFEAQE